MVHTMSQLTYKEFKEMGYERLHRELKKMLAQAERMTKWFNAAERINLLPALQAMHDLVAKPGQREPDPTKPNWEDECRLLGITPEQVRQWKSRTASETDIRHLLGERPKEPGAPPESISHIKRHLEDLARAVLDGNDDRAERLAAMAAEMYRF
jgi:hypothetical protein